MNATLTVALTKVTLPGDSPAVSHVWVDEATLLVGYDPRVLNERLVGLWLDEQFPGGYRLAEGVAA